MTDGPALGRSGDAWRVARRMRPYVEPTRAPRGLDAVVEILKPTMSHADMVQLLHSKEPVLDGFTPLEWLDEDGSPSILVGWVLLSPRDLVVRLRAQLGSKLLAYIAGVRHTSVVQRWADGDDEPSADVLLRFGTALVATAILRQRDSREVVNAWFQGRNDSLGDVSPARALRDEAMGGAADIAVLVAARRHAGLSL